MEQKDELGMCEAEKARLSRSPEELKEHYEVEKELAGRLRCANKKERSRLYRAVYDELFRRVPHHPQLTRKIDATARTREAAEQVRMLGRFLKPHFAFLQLGPGDCEMAFMLAGSLRVVYAVDVSREITSSASTPGNFQLFLSDGTSVPVPPGSIDMAYSNQLMEHLHPEDAVAQLQNILRALKPNGIYICLTPSRILGPHDISKHFDDVATGLHLKEYTTTELVKIFKEAGFHRIRALYDAKGRLPALPALPIEMLEILLGKLPRSLAKSVSKRSPLGKILGVRLVAWKGEEK